VGFRYVPILLKNSIKMEACFSAEKQSILNFSQHWPCKLTSALSEDIVSSWSLPVYENLEIVTA
jgi:hypothetical protein